MTGPFDEVELLIVEDNPNDAELIVRALRELIPADRVFIAEDGDEALDFLYCRGKFTDRNPCRNMKAVFLDLKLPKTDGLEILKEIKADEKTKKTPVVIVSSSREDTDIEAAYALGANGYIVKAVNSDGFRRDISQAGFFWLMINQPPMP